MKRRALVQAALSTLGGAVVGVEQKPAVRCQMLFMNTIPAPMTATAWVRAKLDEAGLVLRASEPGEFLQVDGETHVAPLYRLRSGERFT